MATFNIRVYNDGNIYNGWVFSGTDRGGKIASNFNSTNRSLIFYEGDTVVFSFNNTVDYPFAIPGTDISGKYANATATLVVSASPSSVSNPASSYGLPTGYDPRSVSVEGGKSIGYYTYICTNHKQSMSGTIRVASQNYAETYGVSSSYTEQDILDHMSRFNTYYVRVLNQTDFDVLLNNGQTASDWLYGYRLRGEDKNGTIESIDNNGNLIDTGVDCYEVLKWPNHDSDETVTRCYNPTLNVSPGDTIVFTFDNVSAGGFSVTGNDYFGRSIQEATANTSDSNRIRQIAYTLSPYVEQNITYRDTEYNRRNTSGLIVSAGQVLATPTTTAPTTPSPTTPSPTTPSPTTPSPTTPSPTTPPPTTPAPTTPAPTTPAPTPAPTTPSPTTPVPITVTTPVPVVLLTTTPSPIPDSSLTRLNFQEGYLVTEISTDVFGNRFVSQAERSLVVTGRDSRGTLPSTPTEYSDVDLTYFIENFVDGRTWTEVPEINDNPVFVFEPQNIIIDTLDFDNILYTFYNNSNFLLNFNISFPEEESKFTIKRQDSPLWLRGVFPQESIVKNNNSNGFHQDCGDGGSIPTFEEKHQASIGLQGSVPAYITISSSSEDKFFGGNCEEDDYRYIGAILMGLDLLDGNPSVTTTTVAPCIELESIPDRVSNAPHITSSSSSASVPAGVDMSLHVDELSYNLLHGVSTNIENNQKFITAATLGQLDSYVYFSISSTSTIQIEGTINVTLRSYDLDKIIATKNISQSTKVINFTNSDIINKNLDLSNNNILIEFRSICDISRTECCEPLECLRLFDEINEFCIEDPCNNVLPISNFFTTDRFTKARLILHNNGFVFLDTGYVNTTLESVSDYVVTLDGSLYFRNNVGQLYLLDYRPRQIYSSDDVIDVSNPVSYHQPKIDYTTSTWVFDFDECNIKACVTEET